MGWVIKTSKRIAELNLPLSYWQRAKHLLPGKKSLSFVSYSVNRPEPGNPLNAQLISPVTLSAECPSSKARSVSVLSRAIILSGSKIPDATTGFRAYNREAALQLNIISNYTYTSSFNFVITQQIPKMKVLDFLTSIFKMFNLVAYVEGGIMVVKTLDTFYANPSTDSPYDITKYIDVNSSKVKLV